MVVDYSVEISDSPFIEDHYLEGVEHEMVATLPETKNSTAPANDLIRYLNEEGTGENRLAAMKNFLKHPSNRDATAAELFEWMRHDEENENYFGLTIEKAGRWIYGAGFTTVLPGQDVGEQIAKLQAENANLRLHISSLESELSIARRHQRVAQDRVSEGAADRTVDGLLRGAEEEAASRHASPSLFAGQEDYGVPDSDESTVGPRVRNNPRPRRQAVLPASDLDSHERREVTPEEEEAIDMLTEEPTIDDDEE